MRVNIKVIPRASKNEIIKLDDANYKVRLTAVPVDGKANKELVKYLSEYFKVAKSDIEILKGENDRSKVIEILNFKFQISK